jgi:hypothetical protein
MPRLRAAAMKGPIRCGGVATITGVIGSLLVASSSAVHAQIAVPTALAALIDAVQVAKPPLIDGVVAENEWQGAALASSFIQFEPRRGEPSPIRTESLVLYDVGHLYVAFRAWDSEPVTAQLTQRDAELLRDDAVVLVVDTTNDRRSAYYFITNALGTQADGRIADDGRTTESTGRAVGVCGEADEVRGGRQNSAFRYRR